MAEREWDTEEYWADSRRRAAEIRARYPGLATVGFECLSGWYGILEKYFEAVREAIPEGNESLWSLRQVKEKFGGLRIYGGDYGFAPGTKLTREQLEPVRDKISRAYHLAECRADRTCEVCSKPGRHLIRGNAGGWHLTRCREHADGGIPAYGWRSTRHRIGDTILVYDETLDDLVEIPRRTIAGMFEAEAWKLGEQIESAVLGPLNGVKDADAWPGWRDPIPADCRGVSLPWHAAEIALRYVPIGDPDARTPGIHSAYAWTKSWLLCLREDYGDVQVVALPRHPADVTPEFIG